MARSVLCIFLFLAIQWNYGAFSEVQGPTMKVGSRLGETYHFAAENLGDNANRCVVIHNGIPYEYYPQSNHSRISYNQRPPKVSCSFDLINVQPEDAGTWLITYYPEKNSAAEELRSDTTKVDVYEFNIFDLENNEDESTETIEAVTQRKEIAITEAPVTSLSGHIGDQVSFDAYHPNIDKVVKCIVKHNDEQYEIYPNMEAKNIIYRNRGDCSFDISRLNWEHAGPWTIISHTMQDYVETVVENIDNFKLFVYQNIQTEPSQRVTMDSGYATFYLSNLFENATSCLLTNRDGASYELVKGIDASVGIELYGTCGVRMRIDSRTPRDWVLHQKNGKYEERTGSFSIYWANDDSVSRTHHLYWQRGSSATIKLQPSTYCELVKPDGSVISLADNGCTYKLEVVTGTHAGIWKARYSVTHKMNLIEDLYIVEVWNPSALETSVLAEGDNITMLCISGLGSLNSCSFESPNGTILALKPALGDGKYEYYGRGFTESYDQVPRKAECGLVVRNPSSNDYGRWKCSMRKDKDTMSAILTVIDPRERAAHTPAVANSEVYVKRGNEFTVKCSVDAPLNYCWVRSPNGTVYSVTKEGSSKNSLRYSGEGLLLGVCGAVVENADDTDNGDWSCRLGVVAGKEVESIVPVTVTESELIPLAKEISTYPGSKTILTCRTFPSSEATIDYCRWVKPNGEGLQDDSMTQKTNCSLEYDITSEDFGTWTCFARLSAATDEEVWAQFNVQSERIQLNATNTTLNIVAIALLFTSLISGCLLAVVFYRLRARRNCSPPSQPSPPPAYNFDCGYEKGCGYPRAAPIFPFDSFQKTFKQ